MKQIKIFLYVLPLLLNAGIIRSQDVLPKPISIPLLEAMEGTWVSEPYEFMGSKMNDEADHKMILNGQFMEIDVMSKSDKGFTYQGKGIISPSTDGTIIGWFYDIYGKEGIMTYTGIWENNKILLTGSSKFMDEKREIVLDGDKMIHNLTFDMKMPGMEEMQQKLTVTYKKK